MAFDFPASPTNGQTYTLNGVTYQYNGYAWVQVSVPQFSGVQYPAHGGVQVYRVDANNVGVRLINGGRLIIDGVSRLATAVTNKTIAALTNDTLNYLYAFWTGTAVDYEWSTTGHTTDAVGVEIKTGDPSRTLIAMLFKSSAFTGVRDEIGFRFLLNWFEAAKKDKVAQITCSAASVSSGTQTAIATTYFLAWAGQEYKSILGGIGFSSGGASGIMIAGMFVNGGNVGTESHVQVWATNIYMPLAAVGGVITAGADGLQNAQITGRTATLPSWQLTAMLSIDLRM